jgi:hypothetical protein
MSYLYGQNFMGKYDHGDKINGTQKEKTGAWQSVDLVASSAAVR